MIPIPRPYSTAVQQYVFDADQIPYLDFTGGSGVLPLGHADPYVADAIKTAAAGPLLLGPADEAILPVQERYRRRLAKYFPDESFALQFFASEADAMWTAFETLRDLRAPMSHILVANRYRLPFGMQQGVHRIYSRSQPFSAIPKNVDYAGLMISPIDPDTHREILPSFLQLLLDYARKRHMPIIWDETTTGFGWTGKILPAPDYADYVVLGGALGGGLPLAALVGREIVEQWHTEGRANVLSGSALAYAAGDRMLQRLEEEIFDAEGNPSDRLDVMMDRLEGELDGLRQQFPDAISGLYGSGLLRAVVFENGLAERVQEQAREDGLLVGRSGNVIRIAVPLVATPEDVVEAVGILFEALMKVRESDES